MNLWLAVALGAVVGAPLRAVVEGWVTDNAAPRGNWWRRLPWGLLVVNVIGSAIVGVVLATTTGDLRVLLSVGFCGAFTTFSGYGWQAHQSWRQDRPAFWLTLVTMVVGCTAAFGLTYWIFGVIAG